MQGEGYVGDSSIQPEPPVLVNRDVGDIVKAFSDITDAFPMEVLFQAAEAYVELFLRIINGSRCHIHDEVGAKR